MITMGRLDTWCFRYITLATRARSIDKNMEIASITKTFNFEDYDAALEDWKFCAQRFEHSVRIQGLDKSSNEHKGVIKNLLLNNTDGKYFRLILETYPDIPVKELSYEQVTSTMENKFSEKFNSIFERFKFKNSLRGDG